MSRQHRIRASALALTALAASASVHAEGLATLGEWQQYALRGITPEFSWADRPEASAVEPTLLDAVSGRTSLAPKVSISLSDPRQALSVSISRALAGDSPMFESGSLSAQRLTGVGRGLERTLIAPSLTREISDSAALTAGVVLAYQQFATRGLGAGTLDQDASILQTPQSFLGSSYGTGVRLALEQSLGEDWALHTQFQSKVDMSPLQNYRGLYSRPGDFDLPAVASAGITWGGSSRSSIGVGVSHVMYSEVSPFTSAALPLRFLGLLGDAASPVFTWRDLTVYSLDWNWRPTDSAVVGFHYTTRQQPEPTSQVLRDALAGEFTNDNFGVSLTRAFERWGSLRLAASYAPAQYFLGNASFNNRDARGEQVEVEAVWAMPF
jgi:hypothetical protein